MELKPEQPGRGADAQMTAREGIGNSCLQPLPVAVLEDRLHGRGQVAAIAAEGVAAGAHHRLTGRGPGIGAKAVVKAPAQDLLPQHVHFGLLLRIGSELKQALIGMLLS